MVLQKKVLSLLAIVVALVVILKTAHAANIRVAISGGATSGLNLKLAEAFGSYKKEGLTVEILTIPGGTRSLQVLLSREVQFVTAGLGPVAMANEKKANVKLIAVARNNVQFALFSAREIQTGTELKGKTIGVSAFGAEPDIALTRALQSFGLSRKDVTVLPMGNNTLRMQSLLAGNISATLLPETDMPEARDRGLNLLMDLTKSDVPWVSTSVVTRQDYLKEHPDIVRRFMRANIETSYLALANEKKTKELIASLFKLTPQKADIWFDDYRRTPRFGEVSRQGGENVLKSLKEMGWIETVNVDDHVDYGPFEALKKEGFIAQMQR